jgi:hypothetical protein
LRNNCRGDAQSRCAGQSGAGALQCLQRNVASLSPACRSAVAATMPQSAPPPAASAPARTAAPPPAAAAPSRAPAPPPAAAAPSQPTQAQQQAIRNNCRNDAQSRCPGMSGGQALQCLQRNVASLSPGCRGAVAALSPGAPGTTAAPAAPPAAAAAPAAVPQDLPPRVMLAIGRACRGDQEAVCPAVPIGGGRIIQCLVQNEAALSPGCKQALAAARR